MKKMLMSLVVCVGTILHMSAQENRVSTKDFAVYAKGGQFKPYYFTKHAVDDNEIQIEILYAGTVATFDQINKYFTMTQMPVASSQYWNEVHGIYD